MTTPHKWADVIKAWADGKEIQYRYLHFPDEWMTANMPNFHMDNIQWRIKPETVKYRRYLWNQGKYVAVGALNDNILSTTPHYIERDNNFIRWIDDEWQEEEV